MHFYLRERPNYESKIREPEKWVISSLSYIQNSAVSDKESISPKGKSCPSQSVTALQDQLPLYPLLPNHSQYAHRQELLIHYV